MSAEQLTNYDLSGLNKFNSQLLGAVIGTGRGGDGAAQKLIKIETGQLAWEIQNELGPRNMKTASKTVSKQFARFFSVMPKSVFKKQSQRESGYSGFSWITAGPNWLLGTDSENLQSGITSDAAISIMREKQKSGTPKKKYEQIGQRGFSNSMTRGSHQKAQYINKINRVLLSRQTYAKAQRLILDKFGKLKASVAYTCVQLGVRKKISAIAMRHLGFNGMVGGRAVLNLAGQNAESPYIEFGSRSAGVESNPKIRRAFSGAIARRSIITKNKMEKVIRGFAYDWNTGAVFRKPSIEEN